MKWPEENHITVTTLASGSEHYPEKIASVTMLGSDEKLEWNRDEKGLTVQLPSKRPSEYAYVLKVTK
jgi:alpha-L-fucosidase